jgi:hypothetical protein
MRFAIRDLMWLTVVVALMAGWSIDRNQLRLAWRSERDEIYANWQKERDRVSRQFDLLSRWHRMSPEQRQEPEDSIAKNPKAHSQ